MPVYGAWLAAGRTGRTMADFNGGGITGPAPGGAGSGDGPQQDGRARPGPHTGADRLSLGLSRPVFLGSSTPTRSILGALVRRRAGVSLDDIFGRSLTDTQFEALADAVRTVVTSRLLIELPGCQPGA